MDSVGQRCVFGEHRGTVRYVGTVPPTEGVWYGIEWDTPRGKHNGTLNDTQYFCCKELHGSFVRPCKVSFGRNATAVLKSCYGNGGLSEEDSTMVLNANSPQETLIEMIGFDELADTQSKFENLREVDLSNMDISCACIESGFKELLPNVVNLDLQRNLISSLNDIFLIAGKMEKLNCLKISENMISYWLVDDDEMAFCQLKLLYVNRMQLTWEKFFIIMEKFKMVETVNVCYNQITEIRVGLALENVKVLNLEGNHIKCWKEIMKLKHLARLEKLVLNNNQIEFILIPDDGRYFPSLTAISLVGNNIADWHSVNQLNGLPLLKFLRFKDNPLTKEITSFDLRQELISRLPNIASSNNSEISKSERQTSELYFLKKYSKAYIEAKNTNKLKEFADLLPSYMHLVSVLGEPLEEQPVTSLKEKLLSLCVTCPDDCTKTDMQKSVPVGTTVRQLKGIIQRHYKIPSSKQNLSYVDCKIGREIELDDNMKQLHYFSVSSGDTILLRW